MNEFSYPVLPLRDVVVFPYVVMPLYVGRDLSLASLEVALAEDKNIILLAQKNPDTEEPSARDLYNIGTMAKILHVVTTADGTQKVLIDGLSRVKISHFSRRSGYYSAQVSLLEEEDVPAPEQQALNRTLLAALKKFVNKLSDNINEAALLALHDIENTEQLIGQMVAHLPLGVADKQKLLAQKSLTKRHEQLLRYIEGEMYVMELEKNIRKRVKTQMDASQREYYLNEKIKAIQRELGEGKHDGDEYEQLEKRIAKSGMPPAASEKAMSELKKLRMMSPISSEASVVRGYIDTLLEVPWRASKTDKRDLNFAEQILDEQHYGLEKVKERILEYLAVQQRVRKFNGMILCLVGPPGVGKTSLGRSIAEATGRKFTRMALGGVRDEAEIRGHRRTYIGAMPGKIIQNLSKVGTNNPLFLLDEVDKMAADFRGDPAAALLEVLDPEQNHAFNDNYLDVDYDLSDVMFVATANSMNIPSALLDRMEVIRIAGYTEAEKINIGRRYLLPKQLEANGVKAEELTLPESVLAEIVRSYTREAGVRNLERELAKICRKAVKNIVLDSSCAPVAVSGDNLEQFLGVPRFKYGKAEQQPQIGQVTGLAWTEVGGELLSIEAVLVAGKGKLSITGSLGDVMQESIQAAMTVVRAHAPLFGLAEDFYEKHDFHVHVPEGATPKDGPSAGVAMCTSLVSVLTQIPVREDVAMTGEITLRGEVLAIGGLKEKLLAAHRGGIATVLIPDENSKDLTEIPQDVLKDLTIIPVRYVDEVLQNALLRTPFIANSQTTAVAGSKARASAEVLRHH